MEISRFFCHSDFTWNQFCGFKKCKICLFNTFRSSWLWFFLWIWPICSIFNAKIFQNSKIRASRSYQNGTFLATKILKKSVLTMEYFVWNWDFWNEKKMWWKLYENQKISMFWGKKLMWYKDRQTLVGKDINHSHDFLLHLLLQNMMPRFFWKNCIWFLKCLLENMIIFMWKIWYFTLFLPIMIRNKLKVWNFYILVEIYNAIPITDKTVPWNIICFWSSLQIIWALKPPVIMIFLVFGMKAHLCDQTFPPSTGEAILEKYDHWRWSWGFSSQFPNLQSAKSLDLIWQQWHIQAQSVQEFLSSP